MFFYCGKLSQGTVGTNARGFVILLLDMAKKNKWEENYEIDFELIGVVSPMKEYKLAWHLNQLGIFHLVKEDDIKIEFAEQKVIRISNLAAETDFTMVHLLRNKLAGAGTVGFKYLLPELRQFDYLIKLKNTLQDKWSSDVMTKLKSCAAIDYAVIVDPANIKAKENLIF